MDATEAPAPNEQANTSPNASPTASMAVVDRPTSTSSASISSSHHSRHCKICHHPDRHWIEQDFLHWRGPDEIRKRYGLTGRSAIYRHAQAVGLTAKRSRSFKLALESGIEHVEKVKMTASAVMKAIEAYARLNGNQRWPERPKRVTYHLYGEEALAFLEAERERTGNSQPRPQPSPGRKAD